MNRYILIPEDTIRVLPPEDGVEAAVEVFCSRTVIFFDKFGELVTWYGYQTKNWYYVRTASGKEGYVSKKYVRKL